MGLVIGRSAREVARTMSLMEAHLILTRHRKAVNGKLATIGTLINAGTAAGFGDAKAANKLTKMIQDLTKD